MRDEISLSEKTIRNYWKKVERHGPDECWTWIGGTPSDGYGAFYVNGRQHVATHIALILDGQPRPAVPYGYALHGDCSNPRCVNPRHLRWGTPKENAADCVRLSRKNSPRGEEQWNAKLTEADVIFIRTSTMTGRALAAHLKVSPGTISLVRNRKVWAHL